LGGKIINVNDLIYSTLDIVQISLENKNIKVTTNLIEDNIQLETYPNEVKQVLLNIIKNAEDILVEKKIQDPTITIETTHKNNQIQLLVKDNAGGIPDDILDRVFEPYFSTKTEKDGTGLGLYMSKTIIEEHCGGTLSVKNNDFGAVFKIIL
jgi:signal transduction histidine kinase